MSVPALNEAAASGAAVRRRASVRVAVLAFVAFGVLGVLAARESWQVRQELVWSRGTGWIALALLLLSLVVTPAARIARRLGKRLEAVAVTRRALGMAAAWLALFHAFVALKSTLGWDFSALIAWPHLRAGFTALGILVLLLATSFTTVVVRLRLAFFKELHRLAYVAALLVLAHLLLAPFAPRGLTLALFFATFVLGLARFL